MATHSQNNKLVHLAQQIDAELLQSNLSFQIQASSGSSAAADLSEPDRAEIQKAEEALQFLAGIRKIVDQRAGETLVSDSTISELESVRDPTFPDVDQERFGRFEVIEQIGQGGFAKVFRARDPLLDRDVALKIPKPRSVMSADTSKRFDREAKAAALLSHPAIVQVYEAGRVGLISYIASEYCPGVTLGAWFLNQQRKIDLSIAASIVARLAEAVHHAHQRGIIHRDLKPGNVLVESGRGPLAGRVRITDFGLAKRIESVEESITLDGSVIGTPAYMSPEQACGSKQVDQASDIFSLGVILFELLTGELPFKHENHLATIKAIENETPKLPRRINPEITVDLEAICLKCLNKQPTDRYASAHELSQDLESWLDGRSVSARHATGAEKLVRWAKRKPALAGSLGFALCSLAIGFAVSLTLWQRSESNLKQSDSQRVRALSHVHMLETTVDNILDEYVDMIDTNPILADSHRRILTEVLTVHKKLIDEEAEQLDVNYDTLERYLRIVIIHRRTGDHDEARTACQQASRLLELMPNETEQDQQLVHRATINVMNQAGRIELDAGNVTVAVEKYEAAVDYIKNHPVPGSRIVIDTYRYLGFAYVLAKKFDLAIEARTAALAQANIRLNDDPANWKNHLRIATVTKDIGELLLATSKRNQAIKKFNESLDQLASIENNPKFNDADVRYRTAYVEIQLAEAMRRSKKYVQVNLLIQLALTRIEELIPEQPGNLELVMLKLQANRINVYYLTDIEDYDQLKIALEKTIQLADDTLGKEFSVRDQVSLRNRYASVLHEQFNDSEQAIEVLQEGIGRGISGLSRFPHQQRIVDHVMRSFELLDTIE